MPRTYRQADVAGHTLVFVATGDGSVNADVAADARAHGVWVNAVDDPAHCDFILPSVLRRDAPTVTVSTGGASPALARAIREELEAYFTEDYKVRVRVAAQVRCKLRHVGIIARPEAWRRALDGDVRRLIAAGRMEEARSQLIDRLREATCA